MWCGVDPVVCDRRVILSLCLYIQLSIEQHPDLCRGELASYGERVRPFADALQVLAQAPLVLSPTEKL